MASQLIIPRQLDANGDAVSGAKANVYETGTTTPVTVYTNTGLSIAHANPIVSDGNGYFAQAFYGGSTALKVVVTDSADATLVTYDPVPLVSLSTTAASDVTHSPTTENTATDVQTALNNITDGTAQLANPNFAAGSITDADLANASGLVFIESQDASSSSTLDFTGFDATKYDAYVFELCNVTLPSAATPQSLRLRTSTDGGSTFDDTGGDYAYYTQGELMDGTQAQRQESSATAAFINLIDAMEDGESGASLTIKVHGPHLAQSTFISWNGAQLGATTGTYESVHGAGVRKASADVDAVRFYFAINSIDTGTITMYGLRNS